MEHPLRAINTSTVVLPASAIPLQGFGAGELSQRFGAGTSATEAIQRSYQLGPCGCHVTRLEECGAICPACHAELAAAMQEGMLPPQSPQQLGWLATPCRRHFHECSFPHCSLGGCVRHFAQAPDGKWYCVEHFKKVIEAMALEHVALEHGRAAAQGVAFFRSLFLDA